MSLPCVHQRSPQGIRVRHSRSCSEDVRQPLQLRSFVRGIRLLRSGTGGRFGARYRRSPRRRRGARTRRARSARGRCERRRRRRCGRQRRRGSRAPADGSIRTRSGDAYKPSALRGYEQALRTRILPELGAAKLSEVGRTDVQNLADRLLALGLDPSTIRNALMPLRAIFRRAIARGDVAVNPTTGLELPAVRGRRDRIASPAEAAALLAALPEEERPLWATALYGGLRRGELMALAWEHVDLAEGVIRVERSYDPKAGEYVTPKSRAGTRKVPIAGVLREHLIAHRLRSWSRRRPCLRGDRIEAVRLLAEQTPCGQGMESGRPAHRSACTSHDTPLPRS